MKFKITKIFLNNETRIEIITMHQKAKTVTKSKKKNGFGNKMIQNLTAIPREKAGTL